MKGLTKVGILFLVLTLALGSMGAAFAHWSGSLDITGSVTTGTFDAALTQDVNLMDDEPGTEEATGAYSGFRDQTKLQDIGHGNCVLSDADGDGVMDTITVTVTNAYPCYDTWNGFDVHCVGTVPIKVWYTIDTQPAAGTVTVEVVADPGHPDNGTTVRDISSATSAGTAVKLHDCETGYALIHTHVEQTGPGAAMGTTYSFTMTVHYEQAQ